MAKILIGLAEALAVWLAVVAFYHARVIDRARSDIAELEMKVAILRGQNQVLSRRIEEVSRRVEAAEDGEQLTGLTWADR